MRTIEGAEVGASSRLFVHGLGYVGLRVATHALERHGWAVAGTIRLDHNADHTKRALLDRGVQAFTFDLDDRGAGIEPKGLAALAGATHLLSTVPPVADFDQDPLLAHHRSELLDASSLRWAGYLSSTSVYGDHRGEWVDETSPTLGFGRRAMSRLEAERQWLALREASGGRLCPHIFRLAGIYGPGRSALRTITQLLATAPAQISASPPTATSGTSSAPTPNFVSRCHVDDIVRLLDASMSSPFYDPLMATCNVADDEPAPRAEVLEYAAGMVLGGEVGPPSVVALEALALEENERARRRSRENKRVSNARMRKLLAAQGGILYPTFREGLQAVAESEGHQPPGAVSNGI